MITISCNRNFLKWPNVAHAPFIGYQKTLKLLSLVIVDKVNIKSCSLEQICKSAARGCACASPRVHNNLRAIKNVEVALEATNGFSRWCRAPPRLWDTHTYRELSPSARCNLMLCIEIHSPRNHNVCCSFLGAARSQREFPTPIFCSSCSSIDFYWFARWEHSKSRDANSPLILYHFCWRWGD
jgi:hypothetical protein